MIIVMMIHYITSLYSLSRRIWRYQRGNQNPYIEVEQTTQWPKEKVQKDKQRSTRHTYKTNDRVTRTPLKTGGELRCSGRVSSSCSTSDTCHVNLITNLVISTPDLNCSLYDNCNDDSLYNKPVFFINHTIIVRTTPTDL